MSKCPNEIEDFSISPFNYISFYFMYFQILLLGIYHIEFLGILLCWFLQHYVICVFIPIVVNEIFFQYYKECHFITFQSAYFQMESLWFLLSQSSWMTCQVSLFFYSLWLTWDISVDLSSGLLGFFSFSLSCVQFSYKPMEGMIYFWYGFSHLIFPFDSFLI